MKYKFKDAFKVCKHCGKKFWKSQERWSGASWNRKKYCNDTCTRAADRIRKLSARKIRAEKKCGHTPMAIGKSYMRDPNHRCHHIIDKFLVGGI